MTPYIRYPYPFATNHPEIMEQIRGRRFTLFIWIGRRIVCNIGEPEGIDIVDLHLSPEEAQTLNEGRAYFSVSAKLMKNFFPPGEDRPIDVLMVSGYWIRKILDTALVPTTPIRVSRH